MVEEEKVSIYNHLLAKDNLLHHIISIITVFTSNMYPYLYTVTGNDRFTVTCTLVFTLFLIMFTLTCTHIFTLFLVMTGSQQMVGSKLSKCTYTNMPAMFSIAVQKEKKNTDERKLHGSLHEDYSVERSSDAVQMSVVPSAKTTNT